MDIIRSEIVGVTPGLEVDRQILLAPGQIRASHLSIERVRLVPGATLEISVPPDVMVWLQMLEGEATLNALDVERLGAAHSIMLPPGFTAAVKARSAASLLLAELPEAKRFDAALSPTNPLFMVADWTREAVLVSRNDGRKRIFLVSKDICGTTAARVEMVIYPPGARSAEHYEEGAEALMYVVAGTGFAVAEGKPEPIAPGDIVHVAARERHYMQAAADRDLRFIQFWVPGVFKTVRTDSSLASPWIATGRDISGDKTAIDARERAAASNSFGAGLLGLRRLS